MITRTLMLAGGLSGAVASSQFPEYSQQYMQRLGGAVDELTRQIDRYESDAKRVGLDLPGLLEALGEEGDLSRRQASNIRDDIERRDALAGDLAALEGAGPFSRLRLVGHLRDSDVARRALETYKPAVPATFEGAVFAGSGFVAAWMAIAAFLAFLSGLWSLIFTPREGRI